MLTCCRGSTCGGRYAGWASEVCLRDVPYVEQHAQRKIIDDNKVAAHVNMAVCYLRLAEQWKAKEAAGEDVPEAWHTKPYKAANEDEEAHCALDHLKKAVFQCYKAIDIDRGKGAMKAYFRRGQAYLLMGDFVKAFPRTSRSDMMD